MAHVLPTILVFQMQVFQDIVIEEIVSLEAFRYLADAFGLSTRDIASV